MFCLVLNCLNMILLIRYLISTLKCTCKCIKCVYKFIKGNVLYLPDLDHAILTPVMKSNKVLISALVRQDNTGPVTFVVQMPLINCKIRWHAIAGNSSSVRVEHLRK